MSEGKRVTGADLAKFVIATPHGVPAHVDPDLVRTIDFQRGAGMNTCPHATMAALHREPGIFFNFVGLDVQGRSGYWVPTRADDIRAILQQSDLFSAKGIARFSALMGENWDLIPAETDPPAHTAYRQFLNPMFGPGVVKRIEPSIRAHAVRLIEGLVPGGACEFITAFAKPYPILIVMTALGLPLDRYDDVVGWGHDLHEGTSMEQRARGAVAIGAFLREEMARAAAAEPDETIISRIVHGRIDGREPTADETIGMVYLIFTGGIHTVTASLGFHFDYLGRHPEIQAKLRADRSLIPGAIDEFLRLFGVVNSYRIVTRDTEFGGIAMKAGDWVMIPLPLANYDPAAFDAPDEPDITRKPNRQMSFSFGNHFCLGAHLARAELTIAYQEWLRLVPPFRAGAEDTQITGGALLGVDHLALEWD